MKFKKPYFAGTRMKQLFPTYARAFSGIGTRGFTLLLAALIASIVLSLGTSIYSIAVKQVQLSTLGRDSQFAFYAADTGAECALYWDIKTDSSGVAYDAFGSTAPSVTPTCDAKNLTITGTRSAPPYTLEFKVDFFVNGDGITGTSDDAGYCADVTVIKSATNPHTTIHADGYSVSCASKDASARALQRSVELQY